MGLPSKLLSTGRCSARINVTWPFAGGSIPIALAGPCPRKVPRRSADLAWSETRRPHTDPSRRGRSGAGWTADRGGFSRRRTLSKSGGPRLPGACGLQVPTYAAVNTMLRQHGLAGNVGVRLTTSSRSSWVTGFDAVARIDKADPRWVDYVRTYAVSTRWPRRPSARQKFEQPCRAGDPRPRAGTPTGCTSTSRDDEACLEAHRASSVSQPCCLRMINLRDLAWVREGDALLLLQRGSHRGSRRCQARNYRPLHTCIDRLARIRTEACALAGAEADRERPDQQIRDVGRARARSSRSSPTTADRHSNTDFSRPASPSLRRTAANPARPTTVGWKTASW